MLAEYRTWSSAAVMALLLLYLMICRNEYTSEYELKAYAQIPYHHLGWVLKFHAASPLTKTKKNSDQHTDNVKAGNGPPAIYL